MHPAKAAILNTALAPLWQRLREWMAAAMHAHEHSLDHLTPDQIAPIRTAIFEIEGLLRRLVLVAATAVALDIEARWSTKPKDSAKARARQTPRPIVRKAAGFRLFTIVWSTSGKRLTTTVVIIDNQTNQHTSPAGKRTSVHADSLVSGSSRGGQPRTKHAGHSHHTYISKTPPDMSPEEFNHWCATNDPAAVKAAAEAEYRAAMREPENPEPRRERSANAAQPKLEKKTIPAQIPSAPLLQRLHALAQYVANPEALIRRAAIAMARRREIAYRISLIAPPKPRGHLAVSAKVLGTLIPFHHEFAEAMQYFALSYTEPDTT